MGKLKRKAVSLLNRIQFIDLATAAVQPESQRKDWLRKYLSATLTERKFPSYRYFRAAAPTIYGTIRHLDTIPPLSRGEIEKHVEISCGGTDVAMNVAAALALFDLVRPKQYAAYDHQPRNLQLGLGRVAAIGLDFELVHGEELIFQYPYPRRTRLDDHTIRVMLSLIHHAYAIGDRANAVIELADLSCGIETPEMRRLKMPKVRSPRIVRLGHDQLISRAELEPDVQSIHQFILEIGDEPDPGAP